MLVYESWNNQTVCTVCDEFHAAGFANGIDVCPICEARKVRKYSLSEICKVAKERGISYGQFVMEIKNNELTCTESGQLSLF